MKKCIFILFFNVFLSAGTWAHSQPVTYGELMLADPLEKKSSSHSVLFGAGYDVTNPYLNTYNFMLSYGYDLDELFATYIDVLGFSANQSRYNERLENELNTFGVSANSDRLQHAGFIALEAKLLQGRVNLLSMKALPFQFGAQIGPGFLWNQNGERAAALTWGLASKLFFNKKYGVALRFDQDIKGFWSKAENIYYNRLAVALIWIL